MTEVKLQTCGVILFLLVAVAAITDAARFTRSSSSRIRVSYGYRSLGSSYRYSSRSYGYVDPMSSRRLSPSVMGPLYFGYASRYPNYFSYRRGSSSMEGAAGGTCTNYLALDNGSYIGAFSCPYLPDEPSNWTRCCGYDREEFCCDPAYDDSWKFTRLSAVAIALIVCGCIVAAGLAIGVVVFFCCCCCCAKKSAGGSAASSSAQGQPFVDPTGKLSQVDGSSPVHPPYPTMEYGTMQQPAATTAAAAETAPYPMPLYPPPYSPN